MQVAVDGAELHYSVRGDGPALLVPSSIGTAPYDQQLAPLADFLRVVCVDPRGAGRSTGRAADLTFDVLAADLDAVRADLGVERVAVLGHSALGFLAVEYARRRPDRVSHVILVGTPPYGDMARLMRESATYFEAHADAERKQIFRDNLAALPKDASPAQQLMAQTPMRFFDPRADGRAVFVGAEPRPELIPHVLGTLAPGWTMSPLPMPILIGLGAQDYVVPPTLWDEPIRALPTATRHVFERSGHQPFFEESQQFRQVVHRWMGEISPRSLDA
jgi:proline iminopeptidase